MAQHRKCSSCILVQQQQAVPRCLLLLLWLLMQPNCHAKIFLDPCGSSVCAATAVAATNSAAMSAQHIPQCMLLLLPNRS
jgi:uncharacterized membrane protein YadS